MHLGRFYSELRADPDYMKRLYPDHVRKLYNKATPCYNILVVNKYDHQHRDRYTFIAVIYLHDMQYYSLSAGADACGSTKLDCILDRAHQRKRALSDKMFKFDRFKSRYKNEVINRLHPIVLNVECIDNLAVFLKRRDEIATSLGLNKK